MIYGYFKKFFKYFNEGKKNFILYSAMSLCAAILELLGVALVYPFVIKILSNSSYDNNLIPVCIGIAIVFVFLLKNIFMILFVYMQSRYTNFLEAKIKEKFMKFFLSSDYQATYKVSIAQKSRIFEFLIPNVLNNFVLRLLNLNVNLFIFVIISLLLAVKFPMAVAITIAFAFLMIIFQTYVYKPFLNKSSEKLSASALAYNQAFNETVLNFKSIKISGNEDYFYNRYGSTVKDYYNSKKMLNFLNSVPPYVVEPFVIILLFVLLVIIAMQTYTEPEKLIASFALIASAIFRLAPTIARIQVNINGISAVIPIIRDFIDIYERYGMYNETKIIPKNVCVNIENNIELKNISFGYECNKEILHDINLKINKGDFIGIAGLSGVGKTTLADIISGLFKPLTGNILVDGKILESRINIGYIPQEFKIISGTIAENVAFGNFQIDENKVIDSLKKAQLYDFIIKNYEKGIYENPFVDSTGFSQGQKQRLAIARALYTNPDVLILDEATSSLDLKTEDEICNVLNQLKGSTTIIVIAHRLSTLKSADKVVFMENGTISATGSFEELETNSAGFKEIVDIFKNSKN